MNSIISINAIGFAFKGRKNAISTKNTTNNYQPSNCMKITVKRVMGFTSSHRGAGIKYR